MKRTSIRIFFAVLLLHVIGCTPSKKVQEADQANTDIHSDAYYQSLPNNTERLAQLMSGLFVTYLKADGWKDFGLWPVNNGKDSVVVYTRPVGEPNRDGYWLYSSQMLTSLPDVPLVASFTNLTRISRDSFLAVTYLAPQEYAELPLIEAAKPRAFKDLNFKKLEIHGERIIFLRKDAAHFEGTSNIYKEVSDNFVNYRKDIHNLSPVGHEYQPYDYSSPKEDDLLKKGDYLLLDKRYRLEDTQLYQSLTTEEVK